MKKIAILLLFCHCVSVFSQDLSFDRIIHSQGSNSAISKELVFDKDGALYILGQFEGEVQLDKQRYSGKGKNNVFVAKYTKEGSIDWINPINGLGHIVAHSIVLDEENNIYISGAFGRTCYFGKQELKSTDYQDNFIAKYTSTGELKWVKRIRANTKAHKTILVKGNDGKLLLAGSFFKYLWLGDKRIKAQSNSDIFIAEFDKEGELDNLLHIQGRNQEKLNGLVCSQSGEIYLTGSFTENIKFKGESFNSTGKEDVFVACYQNSELKWAKTMGSPYTDYASKLIIQNDEVLVGGSFSSKIEFDNKQLSSKGALDAFIVSYNNKGELNWASSFGSYANEYLNAFTQNKEGQLYLSGNFRGEIKKDTSKIRSNGLINDLFLAKYSKEGEFIWAKNYGGMGTDYANGLFRSPDNYFYLMGSFEKNIKFEKKKIKSPGGSDFFVSRFYDCYQNQKIELGDDIDACGTEYLLEAQDGFVSYSWSNGINKQDVLINETGNYEVTATDSIGCESTDEVMVTLNPFPEVKLPETLYLCEGSSVRLDAGEGYETYLWNTGAKSRRINAYQAGEYSVEVTNEFGCKALTSFKVEPVSIPIIGLENNYQLLQGEELLIKPAKNFESYQWSTSSAKEELLLKAEELQAGSYDYWLELTDKYGCAYTHNFQVEVKAKDDSDALLEPLIAKINPNPSDGKFRLTLENVPKNKKLELKVFTMGGVFIKELEGEKSPNSYYSQEINLQSLQKGSYLLSIIYDNQSISKEIIIQ